MKTNHSLIKNIAVGVAMFFQLNAFAQVSVIMQRNDLKRTGWNDKETALNTSNVAPQSFGKVFSRTVDDQVYAQPLVISNVSIGGGVHTILLVATVNNSVYAYDADDASKTAPYWQVNLTPAGSRPPKNTDMTGACGGNYKDFSGNIGIVGTPAIDQTNNTIYLVTRNLTSGGVYQQFFHALDLRTGAEKANSPVYINAQVNGHGDGNVNGVITFDQQKQNQRTALMLYNNVVYIAWASHCDWGPYHGWILGYDASTLSQKYVYNTTPEGGNGGVWMSGQGPSVDDNGNFYISTGNGTVGYNGDPNNTTNRGETLMKMTPDLKLLDFFTPSDYQYLEDNDLDYGADGVLLIPNSNISLSGSKEAYLYVVNNNNMGKMAANDANVIQKININADNPNPMRHIHGAPVYYKASSGQEYIYVWAENGWFKQIPFNRSSNTFDEANQIMSKLILPDGMPGGFMSVTSNGLNANTGIIWVASPFQGNANQAVVPGVLRAFDANDIRKEIWNSNMNVGDTIGKFAKFVCPTVANGKVYMATFSKTINVYGALPTAPALRTPENPANATNGIHYKYYQGQWNYIPNFSTLTPVKEGDINNFATDTRLQEENFGYEFSGFVDVPTDGYYTFYVNSDDGSRLYIGNSVVIENDGIHGNVENYGVIGLKAGKHSITIKYFQGQGGKDFGVNWSGPGFAKQAIPDAKLYRVPSTATTATVYQDCNYGGYAVGLATGDYTLAQLNAKGIVDNDLSSLKINSGYEVQLFDADNFGGTSIVMNADNACFVAAGWNDKATSLKVRAIATTTTVYQDCNFGGYAVGLIVGDYTLAQLNAKGILDNDLSSLKVNNGFEVQLFENDNFGGASIIMNADNACFVAAGWNDRASSLKVRATTVVNGTGDGLTANYFNGMNFETSKVTRVDATLNMNWGNGSPDPNVNADQFSARWTGKIQPRYSDTYTFYITSDNGRRVWINNQLVIDKWVDDWDITYTGNIALTAGQKYDIKVEYFENNGGANIKLEWSSLNQTREVIPQSQLYSVPVTNSSITIQAEAYNNMSGIQTETTTDTGGGLNVGWIDANDWMVYNNVNFPTTGAYTIEYRVASISGGKLSCDLNAGATQLGSINVPATGGWQTWTTITQTVNVTAGTYNFGIFAVTGGWNINWFRITKSGAARASLLSSEDEIADNFELYPNPSNDLIHIRSSQDLSGGQVKIYDAHGLEVISVINNADGIDVSSLRSGIYTFVIFNNSNKIIKKFVKQ